MLTEQEQEAIIREKLQNLPVWLIQRVKTFLAFQDFTRAAEEMYRQGFKDAIEVKENE